MWHLGTVERKWGGREKRWRSFLSCLCIIKEHASWERGIKAPQVLPRITWLTAGPKVGLTVARRLCGNSPPTVGRVEGSSPIAPNVRPLLRGSALLPWRRTESVLTARHRSLRRAEACVLRTRQPALNDVLRSGKYPQVLCLGMRGELLQSVKLGLMMASWRGVIVWRWKMGVLQISLQELSETLWFWKDKKVCDSNKMPCINQSLGSGLQLSVEHKTGSAKFSSVYFLPVCKHCTI